MFTPIYENNFPRSQLSMTTLENYIEDLEALLSRKPTTDEAAIHWLHAVIADATTARYKLISELYPVGCSD